MILRRTLLLVVVLAVPAVSAPSLADGVEPDLAVGGVADALGECGGFAPETLACQFGGTMPATSTVHLEAQPEFNGRIGIRLVTSTGQYTASCDFLGVNEPVCRSSTSGTLMIGQPFDAYGTASIPSPVDGSGLTVALGRWRVYITSP
ncbi:MAG TPA: hypothetical protein VGB64_05620 [Actinomycetota bacterium]